MTLAEIIKKIDKDWRDNVKAALKARISELGVLK